FTLSGGFSIFPGLIDQIFYIAPKARFYSTEKITVSAGAIYAGIEKNKFGVVYGVGTLSGKYAALTLGLGYGFNQNDFEEHPVIVLGGEVQIGESTKLITENWIIPGGKVFIYSFGLRIFGEKVAGDFGLFGSSESGRGFPFFPWLGIGFNL
ncbi:MAG: hypothetical protein IAE91_14740, partial [Ignavibacteriaceae bacterium]|nr:hypothetical protein [Ignavibacteriaceae bacterium]